jgi:curved DNA-binding protein CbpA
VTDCFALLGEPRRPWLDPVALKNKYLALAAVEHPDRIAHTGSEARLSAEQKSAALNEAYRVLDVTKTRLAHLIELETGQRGAALQPVSSRAVGLFNEVAAACRSADTLAADRARPSSALLRAQALPRTMQAVADLRGLLAELDRHDAAAQDQLRALNDAWERAEALPPDQRRTRLPLDRLAELQRTFGFLQRWRDQIHDRLTALLV